MEREGGVRGESEREGGESEKEGRERGEGVRKGGERRGESQREGRGCSDSRRAVEGKECRLFLPLQTSSPTPSPGLLSNQYLSFSPLAFPINR